MIGGGNKTEELKDLCNSKGLQSNFVGYLNKQSIVKYLQKSDYFIHASTIETFGIVTAEALFCGTPVICSNVGALPELINDSNGVLCENTLDKWVEGLKEVINIKFNNAEIAKKIQSKFSKEIIANNISDIYGEV
jgi:glycosyltransferase involved in cell wall biosynthesis